MSWLSFGVRIGGFAVVFPLALATLSDAEISVWLLFSAVASFHSIVDFGFSPTFAREVAYGFSGHSISPPAVVAGSSQGKEPNEDWRIISTAVATMAWLYRRIAFGTLFLLVLLGTVVSWGPVDRIDNSVPAWIAWIAVVVSTPVAVYGNRYSAFLIGADHIALLRLWEAVISACSLATQAIAVICGAGLVGLVVSAQTWLLVQVLVNRRLSEKIADGRIATPVSAEAKRRLVNMMWPAAWRTASGTILSLGLSQGMSIAMANVLAAAEAASIQFTLRLMQLVSQVSQVPFYTRIPTLNRLRITDPKGMLVSAASLAMRRSLWLFVATAIVVGMAVTPTLHLIGSAIEFPREPFWAVLVLAVFFERFGAMHVQLLLTKNRAIAHVANGVAASVWVLGLVILFPTMGALALPIGMLIAYAGFYAVIGAYFSHAELETVGLLAFEAKTSLLPAIIVLLYAFFEFL